MKINGIKSSNKVSSVQKHSSISYAYISLRRMHDRNVSLAPFVPGRKVTRRG